MLRYLGADVAIHHTEPDPGMLGETCKDCGQERCLLAAVVSWSTFTGPGWAAVGRECLPLVLDRARADDATEIVVDLPVWRGPALCATAGISYRQLDFWVRGGILRPEEVGRGGSGSVRHFLADEVTTAFLMGELIAVSRSVEEVVSDRRTARGVSPRLARRLIETRPDVARAVVEALRPIALAA